MKNIFPGFLSILTFQFSMAQTTHFEIQGHRGCRGLLPENTIPAFLKALDLGVNTLELDVIITKDKRVLISHDPFFNPAISTDPTGKFVLKESDFNTYQLDYQEIAKFDVGLRGNPNFPEQQKTAVSKPLLADMLKAVEVYRKEKKLPKFSFNIELKSLVKEYDISQPQVAEFCQLVYDEIMQYVSPKRVVIQSFDFNILSHWNKQMQSRKFKKMQLSALIEPESENDIQKNLAILGFKPAIWSPYFATLDDKKVETLHQLGIKVIPWTVNTIDAMKKIKALGCDGLITDYPDRAKNL